MSLSDEELVEKSLAGEDACFEELVNRHLKPVYNFMYRLTNDSAALDDLTQDTFIKVWKNLARFDPARNFRTWLFAIAKNTAYDYLKKKKTLPFSFFTDQDGNNKLDQIKDQKSTPDQLARTKDTQRAFEQVIKGIPPHYRIVILLHYKNDFTFKEIAGILKVPYNTVKSRHQRALRFIKNQLPGVHLN